MAIIGNNFPVNTEKVTINGEKVKEKIEMFNYLDYIVEEKREDISFSDNLNLKSNNISILNNGNYLQKDIDTKKGIFIFRLINKNSPYIIASEANITIDIPSPQNIDSYKMHQENDETIWLEIRMQNYDATSYWFITIYKLSIINNILTIELKEKNIQSYSQGTVLEHQKEPVASLVDSTGIYMIEQYSNISDGLIMTSYQFDSSSQPILKPISQPFTHNRVNGVYSNKHTSALKKINNTYCFFYNKTAYSIYAIDCCLTITRIDSNNFSEEVHTDIQQIEGLDSMNSLYRHLQIYSYNNNIYCVKFQPEKFEIYQLINNNWNKIQEINVAIKNTYVEYYKTIENFPVCIQKSNQKTIDESATQLTNWCFYEFNDLETGTYNIINTPNIKSCYMIKTYSFTNNDSIYLNMRFNNGFYTMFLYTAYYDYANTDNIYSRTIEKVIFHYSHKPLLYTILKNETV